MTDEERERRIEQLSELIRGARAELPSWYVANVLPHFAPADDHQRWLRTKIVEWKEERAALQAELGHGWSCDCADCYFGRLELEIRHGLTAE